MEYINRTLPGIALRGLAPIPDNKLEFDLSRERSIHAAQSAMTQDRKLFLIAQKDINVEDPNLSDLELTGVIAEVTRLVKLPNENVRASVNCLVRAMPVAVLEKEPGLLFEVGEPVEQAQAGGTHEMAMSDVLQELLQSYISTNPRCGKEIRAIAGEREQLAKNLNTIAANSGLNQKKRQTYLDLESIEERFRFICDVMSEEIEISKYRQEIQQRVKDGIDKNQKEYVLREQMRVIKSELGEDEEADSDELNKKLERLEAPEEVREKLTKEIARFRMMPAVSQEAMLLRNYIDSLLEMPWNKGTTENIDLLHAKAVLDEDHYGLEKVKERILEYLAVRCRLAQQKQSGEQQETQQGDRPILCLVGPPGTGKTSIARSIARALDKKYVRICLGGIRDEAEIRGHRKTYIGAMPGRIANGIRQAGVRNPVMLLDEIDKVGNDYKGDPSAALLEVLDPEQNCAFRDHFLEVPLNLSEVLFIATANSAQTIPAPLLDRMEMIEISGYTENEKFHIAQQYLVGKQCRQNGLQAEEFTITDPALEKLIRSYTREAGVRQLERRIAELCRKAARRFLEEESCQSIEITEEKLPDFLGKEKYRFDMAQKEPQIGIARGLAWTSVGGDTLEIEVGILPGKGTLLLTGKLGDVMKESASIALSYVRMRAALPDSAVFFAQHDIHVHVPEGAVPKDGPSAGITIATAMYSAVTERAVRADVAMTGEVTLRGRVLPIGGLKEKLLAAAKCGVKTVLVPEENHQDVEELSEEITAGLSVVYVSHMDEVLQNALVPPQ